MIVSRELDIRVVDTIGEVLPFRRHQSDSAEAQVIKSPQAELMGDGTGILIVDDLVDSAARRWNWSAALPQGAFRHRLRQAPGRQAAGRHLCHRGQPGHLDLLPLGHGAAICPAVPRHGLTDRRAD
jgi:hypothetical protein